MRDDSAEILFQSLLQDALASSSGIGRDISRVNVKKLVTVDRKMLEQTLSHFNYYTSETASPTFMAKVTSTYCVETPEIRSPGNGLRVGGTRRGCAQLNQKIYFYKITPD